MNLLKKLSGKIATYEIVTVLLSVIWLIMTVIYIVWSFWQYFVIKNFNISIVDIAYLSVTVIFLGFAFLTTSARNRIREREEIELYSSRLEQAIVIDNPPLNGEPNPKEEINTLGLMQINLRDIKEFYTWSQKQAVASFVLAVVMCIAGFLLISISIGISFNTQLNSNTTFISAAGGVITELIAGTALVVYRSSMQQLNYFHKALHEDQRFLSSVNLVDKFSSIEIQDNMLREIVRTQMKMSDDNDTNTHIDTART